MGVTKVAVDPVVEARLGADVLADLKVNLWAVDCQTCGRRLSRWGTPALVVHADGDTAVASLHHQRCQRSGWEARPPLAPGDRPHLTWRAGTAVLPASGLALFLVNPSYEAALLRHGAAGGWRVRTVESFVELGLSMEMSPERATAVPALSAMLDGDRISVEARVDGAVAHAWPNIPISPAFLRSAYADGQVMVAVGTLVDVRRPLTETQITGLMAYRRLALGAARIARFPAMPRPPLPGDVEERARAHTLALATDAIQRRLGTTLTRRQLHLTDAVRSGDHRMIGLLTRRDLAMSDREQALAVLPVVLLYASRSRDRRGVHIVTKDAGAAHMYWSLVTPVADELSLTVGQLGDPPSSPAGAEAYLADIVVGTFEQFADAYGYYLRSGPAWESHAGRGYLAVIAGLEPGQVATLNTIRHYPRVIAG